MIQDLEITSLNLDSAIIGKTQTYGVTIKNTGNVTHSGLVLVAEKTGYVYRSAVKVPSIGPFSSVILSLEVDVKSGATVDDLVQELPLRLQNSTGRQLCRQVFHYNSMWWFKNIITNMSEGFPLKILAFGMAGSTKSSFIETCMNIMEYGTEVHRGRIRIGGSSGHVTTDLRCHTVGGINLWDTWGLTGKNYKGAELRAILQGKLPDKWGMYDQIGDHAQVLRLDAAQRKYRAPQACLVFVPHASFDNEEELAALKFQIEFIRDAGINPIIVLSLVDTIDEQTSRRSSGLRENAMAPSPRLLELMQHAATTFSVPRNMVTYTVNYESETTRDFNIERLCFKNLMMAIKAAKACQRSREEAESDGPTQGREPAWLSKVMARVRLDEGSVPRAGSRGGAAAAPSPTNPLAGGVGSPAASVPSGPLCIVCDEERADVMVQPCGHLCLCSTCAPAIKRRNNQCPMCRKDIERVQNVYY